MDQLPDLFREIGEWIYHFQTFIAGLLALVAAAITFLVLKRQLDVQTNATKLEYQSHLTVSGLKLKCLEKCSLSEALGEIDPDPPRLFFQCPNKTSVIIRGKIKIKNVGKIACKDILVRGDAVLNELSNSSDKTHFKKSEVRNIRTLLTRYLPADHYCKLNLLLSFQREPSSDPSEIEEFISADRFWLNLRLLISFDDELNPRNRRVFRFVFDKPTVSKKITHNGMTEVETDASDTVQYWMEKEDLIPGIVKSESQAPG